MATKNNSRKASPAKTAKPGKDQKSVLIGNPQSKGKSRKARLSVTTSDPKTAESLKRYKEALDAGRDPIQEMKDLKEKCENMAQRLEEKERLPVQGETGTPRVTSIGEKVMIMNQQTETMQNDLHELESILHERSLGENLPRRTIVKNECRGMHEVGNNAIIRGMSNKQVVMKLIQFVKTNL